MATSATLGSDSQRAQSMSHPFDQLMVPTQNKTTLTLPPLTEYSSAAKRNATLNSDILLDGEPLTTFRLKARSAAIDIARAYTLSLGLDPGPVADPAALVIGSGHQPVHFHAGIMIKPVALVRAARELGATPLFMTVDSDEFRAEYLPLPSMENDKLERLEYPLFPMKKHGLYETTEAEPVEDMLDRLRGMVGYMAHPRLASPRRALESYLATLGDRRLDFPDYVSRAIVMRRAWLAPEVDGFLELPVSALSKDITFLRFASFIMADIERFAGEYNLALDEYRRERKLRYPANPFPNLETHNGLIQAPFWVVEGGGRRKLYVKVAGGKASALVLENGEEFPMTSLMERIVAIRPKAITLSLYLRLALSDLFIHGVGGAKYDHVTDAILERYFQARPPESACLSAALWIDISADDPRQDIAETERRIREIEQHPEKAGAGVPEVDRLAALKKELVLTIKAPGADKKSIGASISELNRLMAAELSDERSALCVELERLAPLEMERLAAQARDYPCFICARPPLFELAELNVSLPRDNPYRYQTP